MGVGSAKRSFSRARNSGSVRPRAENAFNGTKWMLRRPGVANTGALVFACPRDNRANVLERFSGRARRPERTKCQSRNLGIGHLYAMGLGRSKGLPRIWLARAAAMPLRLPI